MPNPASVYCEENGGELEIREDASGGQAGICIFPDSSECDEWAYFRGECQPQSTVPESLPTPTAERAADGWNIYYSNPPGYTFHYPADAIIETAADPLQTITILGPMIAGDNWPVIYVNHPGDREEYRPPIGIDLAQWLTDHNLLTETRQPDMQIAGTTAIHTRHDRSPQSYAFDTFYFAYAGQLYNIVILHTGDKEDWHVYDRFLHSFEFTPKAVVMALSQPKIYSASPSSDEKWQASVVIFDCVPVDEQNMLAYEQLTLNQTGTGNELIIDEQLRNCGGLGTFGLDILFWSPNSRYVYFTDAREGGLDGCGYWAGSIIRFDVTTQEIARLGGGPMSPDQMKLITWQGNDLVVWDIDQGETGRVPAYAGSFGPGPVVWSPDSQAVATLQVASYCPISGASNVVRLDLSDLQPRLLLTSADPTFAGLAWNTAGAINLVDGIGGEWVYTFATAALTPAP